MKSLSEPALPTAREFYRRQLIEAFRYSRQFAEPLGSFVSAVADTADFEAVLHECSAGSFESARRIGEMAVVHLDKIPLLAALQQTWASAKPLPMQAWWRDLLNFERGHFLQAATTAEGPPTNRPRRGVSAVCMQFSWMVSELAERIQAGATVGDDLCRPATLVFARSQNGRACVVEVGPDIEKVFRATNGLRTAAQVAGAAGLSLEGTEETLAALASIGAVVPAMSPEEMSRLINKQQASSYK